MEPLSKQKFYQTLDYLQQKYKSLCPEFDITGFIKTVHRRYFYELEQVMKNAANTDLNVEIGASPFVFSVLLKLFGLNFISIDLQPGKFQPIIDEFDLHVEQVDIQRQRFPFDNDQVDYVHFSEVFEHLYINPFHTLSEMHRILKPGGLIYFSTPNFYSVDNLLRIILGKSFRDGFEEVYRILSEGYPGHIREYTTAEMKKFFNYAGFEVKDLKYKFFSKSRYFFVNILFKIFVKLRATQIFLITK